MARQSLEQTALCAAVDSGRFEWSLHAVERPAARGIRQEDVLRLACEGELIEDYPDARPFPSALLLGRAREGERLHVVAAYDVAQE